MSATTLDMSSLAARLGRVERRKRVRAMALTIPLLVFLALTFLVPLGALDQLDCRNSEEHYLPLPVA